MPKEGNTLFHHKVFIQVYFRPQMYVSNALLKYFGPSEVCNKICALQIYIPLWIWGFLSC